jgi:hypothetical protein
MTSHSVGTATTTILEPPPWRDERINQPCCPSQINKCEARQGKKNPESSSDRSKGGSAIEGVKGVGKETRVDICHSLARVGASSLYSLLVESGSGPLFAQITRQWSDQDVCFVLTAGLLNPHSVDGQMDSRHAMRETRGRTVPSQQRTHSSV